MKPTTASEIIARNAETWPRVERILGEVHARMQEEFIAPLHRRILEIIEREMLSERIRELIHGQPYDAIRMPR